MYYLSPGRLGILGLEPWVGMGDAELSSQYFTADQQILMIVESLGDTLGCLTSLDVTANQNTFISKISE